MVLPFVHRWPQSVPVLYNGSPTSKLPLLMADLDPPSNTWLHGPTWLLNPNGTSIGSAILEGSLVWQTDRATDHGTRPVTIGRIYVRSTAMRPKRWRKKVSGEAYDVSKPYTYITPKTTNESSAQNTLEPWLKNIIHTKQTGCNFTAYRLLSVKRHSIPGCQKCLSVISNRSFTLEIRNTRETTVAAQECFHINTRFHTFISKKIYLKITITWHVYARRFSCNGPLQLNLLAYTCHVS